jgi:hypothetical protein
VTVVPVVTPVVKVPAEVMLGVTELVAELEVVLEMEVLELELELEEPVVVVVALTELVELVLV